MVPLRLMALKLIIGRDNYTAGCDGGVADTDGDPDSDPDDGDCVVG